MRRYIALLLALLLCFGLAACGEKEPEMLGEEVAGGMTDEHVAMMTEIVKEYMDTDSFKALAERAECKGVKSAMYYEADGAVEGIDLKLLLIELDADENIVGWDRLLVADSTEQSAYDAAALGMNDYMGEMETYEDLTKMVFGGFDTYLMDPAANGCIMTELEVRTPATDAQIEAINAALAG